MSRLKTSTAAAAACTVVTLLAGAASGRTAPHRGHGRPKGRPAQAVVAPRQVTALGADEAEYRIRLTRPTVAAGPVKIEVSNVGQDPHNLVLSRADGTGALIVFPTARSGSRQTQTVTLTAGTWTLYCSLPGHEQLGMRATIVVRPGGLRMTTHLGSR